MAPLNASFRAMHIETAEGLSDTSEKSADSLRSSDQLEPLDGSILETLRGLNASILANSIERFHNRLHNEGFVDHTVSCLCPHTQAMVGYAATLRIRGSAPPTAGGQYPDRTDWWDYVLSLPEPRVAVLEDVSSRPGLGSLIGAVHMNILRALRCVGVVTNGAVRDLPAAESAGFYLFAGNVAVSHTYVHIVEIGQPVQIGGLKIKSGDLLHGDRHGVQSVPLDIAAKIPSIAAELARQEQAIIDLCRSPDFSLEKLRAAVSKG